MDAQSGPTSLQCWGNGIDTLHTEATRIWSQPLSQVIVTYQSFCKRPAATPAITLWPRRPVTAFRMWSPPVVLVLKLIPSTSSSRLRGWSRFKGAANHTSVDKVQVSVDRNSARALLMRFRPPRWFLVLGHMVTTDRISVCHRVERKWQSLSSIGNLWHQEERNWQSVTSSYCSQLPRLRLLQIVQIYKVWTNACFWMKVLSFASTFKCYI